MANYKKRKSRNRCAGCKMCKPWKIEGVGKNSIARHPFSEYKRRKFAAEEIKEV